MTIDTKKWSDHKQVTGNVKFITRSTADKRSLACVAGKSTPTAINFHIYVGGTEMVSVHLWVKSPSQLRAEQLALAWTRTRWAKDRRSLCVLRTEIVD
jgi:hypothetical protein